MTELPEPNQHRTEVEDPEERSSLLILHFSAARKSVIRGPIRFLPPEILGQIFVEWVKQQVIPTWVLGAREAILVFCAPIQLMSVCSRWFQVVFQVVLSTPKLWAVGYHYVTVFDSRSRLKWFRTIASRAGSSLLKVSYHGGLGSGRAANPRVWKGYIRPLLPRLAALQIHCIDAPECSADLDSARCLQDLTVASSQLDLLPVERDKPTVLHNLRSISLTDNNGGLMQMQTPSLVSFFCIRNMISSSMLKHIAESSPVLEEITFKGVCAPGEESSIAVDEVVFPQMRILRIGRSAERCINLNWVNHCPQLNTLEIHVGKSTFNFIATLPLRSYPCLRSLVANVDRQAMTNAGWRKLSLWIATGSTITHLKFSLATPFIWHHDSDPRHLLGNLRHGGRGGGCCAKLEHLIISGDFGADFELALWYLMLERSAPIQTQERYGYSKSRLFADPVQRCSLTLKRSTRKMDMISVDWEEFERAWGPNYPSPGDSFEPSHWGFDSDPE